MSLDVSLIRKFHVSYDNGKTLEEKEEELFDANITHNLVEMADKAGIYEACWRPYRLNANYKKTDNYNKEMEFEDSVETKAKDILPLLEKGYADLKARPEYFKQFDSPNGWGLYDHFLPWVKNYMDACKKYPDAYIYVSR